MEEAPEKIYKFALIGVGRWGKNYIKTIEQMSGVQITHLCTRNPENAKLIKKNKVKVVKNYMELCSDRFLDGVIVATPPHTHHEIVCSVAHSLLPVMVEKPLSLSLEEAISTANFLKEAKVPVLVDHTQLFNPAYEELVTSFKNDQIKTIDAKVCSFGPFRKDVSMLWDWAPHDISMVINLMKGKPAKVKASLVEHENYDNSGQLLITLKYKNTDINIKIDNLSGSKYRSFRASSNSKTITLFGEELYETRGDWIRTVQLTNEKPLQRAIMAFVDAIETNSMIGLDLAVDVAAVIEKCQKSIDNDSEFVNV